MIKLLQNNKNMANRLTAIYLVAVLLFAPSASIMAGNDFDIQNSIDGGEEEPSSVVVDNLEAIEIDVVEDVEEEILKEEQENYEEYEENDAPLFLMSYLPPQKPEPTNTCTLPDTSGALGKVSLGVSAGGGTEPSLQQILNDHSYSLDAYADQNNVQLWNVSSGKDKLKLSVKVLSHNSAKKHVFGYYVNGDPNTFVGMFEIGGDHTEYSLPIKDAGDIVDIEISASGVNTIGFATHTQSKTGNLEQFFSEIVHNADGDIHVVVYNPSANSFVLGFEDQNKNVPWDRDHQDLVVRINTECIDFPQEPKVTIVATKVVCDDESDLPNWSGTGITIDADTASDFVSDNAEKCRLEPGWQFQWGYNGAGGSYGEGFIGEAPSPWVTFPEATDSQGKTSTVVPIPNDDLIWVREVLKAGYIPFAGGPGNLPGSDVSAEMYCHKDVLNYDNYDFINNLIDGGIYYCVALNALKPIDPNTPSANLTINKVADRSSANVGDAVTYTINLSNGGPDNATGVQVTEQLHAGLTFVSATSTLGTYSTSTGLWIVGGLNNSSSTTLTIVATIKDGYQGQTISNTATVTATETDPDPSDNSSSVNVAVNNPGGGGGGGGGGGRSSGSTPIVAECSYLRDYLRRDFNNDPLEVLKLQAFLINFEGHTNVSLNGVFDQATFDAVSAFQVKYFNDILEPWGHTGPTGYVYILTLKKINEIYCQRLYPLNDAQIQEIIAFRALLESLVGQSGAATVSPVAPSGTTETVPATEPASSEEGSPIELLPIVGEAEGSSGGGGRPSDLAGFAAVIFAVPDNLSDIARCLYWPLLIIVVLYILGSVLKDVLYKNTPENFRKRFLIKWGLAMDLGLAISIVVAYILGRWCLILPLIIALILSLIWTSLYPRHNSIRASIKSWFLVVWARVRSFFKGKEKTDVASAPVAPSKDSAPVIILSKGPEKKEEPVPVSTVNKEPTNTTTPPAPPSTESK